MLTDPSAQAALLGHVKAGLTREDAARQVGLSGRTVSRFADRDPSFSNALRAARADGRGIRALDRLVHPPPRKAPANGWPGGMSKQQRQARRLAEIQSRLAALQGLASGGRP